MDEMFLFQLETLPTTNPETFACTLHYINTQTLTTSVELVNMSLTTILSNKCWSAMDCLSRRNFYNLRDRVSHSPEYYKYLFETR